MRYLGFLLLLGISPLLSAQTCLSTVPETSPVSALIDNADGTVSDQRTGLVWMSCSLGQTWTSSGCEGDATELSWQQALQRAHGYEFNGVNDWRVPNLKELSTITERSCVRPAVNATVFPNTPSDDYWTSTPSVTDPSRAWSIAFFNSSNAIRQKSLFGFVRLVRTAD